MQRILTACSVLFSVCPPLRAATTATTATATNPENAAETARIDALYQQKKAALPPERQAWETLLEENLGHAFYLPRHKRDFVNGVSSAWDFVVDDPRLPRVLLIGDSISRAYTQPVRTALVGTANLHRAPENCGPTANGLKKIDIWLGDKTWDLIIFNFGIHDRATPLPDYETRLDDLTRRLLRTGATLVWATTTPLPERSIYGSDAAIVARNAIAAQVMRRHRIAIVDLYAAVAPRLTEFQKADDVHFSPAGYEFLAKQITTAVTTHLARRP